MLPPALSYCMFMLSCFGALQKGPVFLNPCPRSCECYDAPADGLLGTSATSLICTHPLEMLTHRLFRPTLINTLVIQYDQFQHPSFFKLLYKFKNYPVISLILEDFTPTNSPKNYIFQIFDPTTLQYLSLYKSTLVTGSTAKFSWTSTDSTSVELFPNLQVINIDGCQLEALDESFRHLQLQFLHTLIIRSSQLSFIDRDAFAVGKSNLKRLILADNKLKNLIWLTAAKVWSNLWYLDLSSNQLTYLPADLKSAYIPNVQVLNLANNQFLYFDLKSLQPWFAIDELMLSRETQDNFNSFSIYYTKNTEWIKHLTNYQIEANFALNSFAVEFQYYCPEFDIPVNWEQFSKVCSTPFDYDPNRLYFDSEGKLLYGKDVKDGQLPTLIHGLETTPVELNLRLDTATNADQFTANHRLFKEKLNLLKTTENAIRVAIFGQRMWSYFMKKTELTDGEIQLILDQVEDFLDEVQNAKKFVVLVLWDYEEIKENVKHFTMNMVNLKFKDKIIEPLLIRLVSYTSLLGLELVSRFFSGQFTDDQNKFTYPNTFCDTDQAVKQIADPQLRFLENIAQMVKQLSGELHIGISIDANCRLCLPLVLIDQCLPLFSGQFSFVTIHSNLLEVNKEPYSYVNYFEQPKFPNMALFYVLQGGNGQQVEEATDKVMQYSAGYFVA